MDLLLEPVWVTSLWKIPSLKAPGASRSLPASSDRKSFCENLVVALEQLRARQKAFDEPRFRRRLADTGLAGYAPRLAIVLGEKDVPVLPHTPPDGFGKEKAVTFTELLIQAKAEMEWMAGPTDLLECKIDTNERNRKILAEMAVMWGNNKG